MTDDHQHIFPPQHISTQKAVPLMAADPWYLRKTHIRIDFFSKSLSIQFPGEFPSDDDDVVDVPRVDLFLEDIDELDQEPVRLFC